MSDTPKQSPSPMGSKVKNVVDRQKREEERLERIRQKEAERLRKEEEKRLREEERKRKEIEKEAEKARKEEEKRKKDEEREQERLRKEEEKRKREEERLRKEEEKRKKDEELKQERLRKEEEKRQKDEEKRQKEEEREQERLKREEEKRKREDEKEQERLKKKMKLDEKEQKTRKQAEFMQSFLKKSTTPVANNTPSTTAADTSMEIDSPETPKFRAMPFQLKSGMALAPVHRRPSQSLRSVRKELFGTHSEEGKEADMPDFEPYLIEIKKRGGRKTKRTEVIKSVDDEVEIIDPKNIIENPTEAGLIKWRWKLLQFDKSRRPAYWGTWKRRATKIKPRTPFAKEDEIDYEFDSDDEWEDEPEDGEDLGDKDDDDKEEDEKCSVGDDEDEDDFLVPHGYLSDDEGGVAEYRDKDTLKNLEDQFYRDLKKENINGYPVIETENLEQYAMIFYPTEEDESDIPDGDTDDEIEIISVVPAPLTPVVAVIET